MNKVGSGVRGIAGEFREFIARGNVIDMAVGVVVGGAFTAIVNSLVGNLITPILGLMLGGMDLSGFKLVLRQATDTAEEVALQYGAFIQQVISFIIIAACVFALVKALGAVVAKGGGIIGKHKAEPNADGADAGSAASEDQNTQLLREIRDLLRASSERREQSDENDQ